MINKEKLAALLTHLILSCLIVLILLYVVFYHWYPNGLIYAGGIEGLTLIGGIDIILGPLLTFVVYKKGKKGLAYDLAFIVILQFSALSFGTWQVHSQRPVAAVLMDDGIHLISYADATKFKVDLDKFGHDRPLWLFMDLPEDASTWASLKNISEFADMLPFLFRQDLYKQSFDIPENEYIQRVQHVMQNYSTTESKKLNSLESNCTWLRVHSIHVRGYVCANQVDGIQKLLKSTQKLRKV